MDTIKLVTLYLPPPTFPYQIGAHFEVKPQRRPTNSPGRCVTILFGSPLQFFPTLYPCAGKNIHPLQKTVETLGGGAVDDGGYSVVMKFGIESVIWLTTPPNGPLAYPKDPAAGIHHFAILVFYSSDVPTLINIPATLYSDRAVRASQPSERGTV